MGGYPVSLSSIGAIQQICETFFWSLLGKHQKTRFFDVFWPKTNFFPDKVVNFIVGAPFTIKWYGYPVSLSSIGAIQQICETFFRSLLGKHVKKPVFSTFFGPKLNFFPIKVVNFIVGAPFTTKWVATL